MKTKTIYFKNCYGVFEGGGCRGAAYLGAYKAAVERGVNFAAVAGTSAGAIISSIIGAGATVKELEDILSRLDFTKFITANPERIADYRVPWWPKTLANFYDKKIGNIISSLGMYSSIEIENFITNELGKLLGKSTPVLFKDLKIPTTIIATDLKTKKAKIWSTNLTPDEEVAKAVRASSSIPFFFQPVLGRYIDGGAISNLPSFVFSELEQRGPKKILAFCLESQSKQYDITNLKKYCNTIFETLIDGAKDLQLRLQRDVHIIKINTGDVSSVDFEKASQNANYLVTQGEDATNDFFEKEVLNIKGKNNNVAICKTYFQTYEAIAQTVDSNINEVFIIEHNTDWVYKLFPTVLSWFMNNAKVTIILTENSDDTKHGPYRQRLLKSLGANLIFEISVPFRAFLFNPLEEENALAIVRNERQKDDKVYDSMLYKGKTNAKIIEIFYELGKKIYFKDSKYNTPKILTAYAEDIINKLKTGVNQYNRPGVSIEYIKVDISELYSLTKFVTGFKYIQVNELYDLYKINNIEPFTACKIQYNDLKETFITPPVIEDYNGKKIIIEGTTRITYAFHNNIKSIYAIVVSGLKDALPASGSYKLNELQVTDEKVEAETRYEGFDLENFRSIEKSIRNPRSCLL